jgi:hypothetical protein
MTKKKSPTQLDREIAESLAGKTSSGSLYQDLKAAGIPTDHHESDLYVRDTPAARALIAKHGKKGSGFTSQINRKQWLDVPFAYDPFWAKKSGRAHSTIATDPAPKPPKPKPKRVPKTRMLWVVQGNYGYGHGWEDVTATETWKEAKGYLREYRENERGVPFRTIRRREKIAT